MNKEEIVILMVDSINENNRQLCEQTGMDKDQAEKQIAESQPSLRFLMENVYNKLVEKEIIKG
jgi:hypothetical protein